MKDSRSAPGCGGVTEVVIVHPGRAVGSWTGRKLNYFSFCYNFVIEKGHEIVTATGYRNIMFDCIVVVFVSLETVLCETLGCVRR